MLSLISNPAFLLAAIPAVLISAISKGGFGGGLGIVSVPLLALVISPAEAAAIMLPLLCVMDVIGVRAYWGIFDRQVLWAMLPGSLLGIVLGTLAFGYLDDNIVRLLLGIIATVFAARFLIGTAASRIATSHNTAKGAFWGMLGGFTSTLAHAGGPPANVYMLPLRMNKTIFVGTSVILFAVINLAKILPYAVLGLFEREVLWTALILAPVAALGMFLGVWLHKRVSDRIFYTSCYIFVLLTGLKLIWDGARGLF